MVNLLTDIYQWTLTTSTITAFSLKRYITNLSTHNRPINILLFFSDWFQVQLIDFGVFYSGRKCKHYKLFS